MVAKLTPAELRGFHKKLAVAKNGVLAVFGDVNADEVYALAKKAFADLPAGDAPLANPAPAAKIPAAETALANRPKNQAIVMVGYSGADLLSADRPALELIDTASSDLGSRFFDRIREKLGLAYFVGTSQLMGPTPGAFVFYLGTDPSKVDQVRKEFSDEIHKLATGGLTPEELARAKKKLLGAEAIRDQSDSAMSQAIALDELFGLGADHYQKRKAEIESITLEDTKRIADKYFNQPGSIEVIVAPPKDAK